MQTVLSRHHPGLSKSRAPNFAVSRRRVGSVSADISTGVFSSHGAPRARLASNLSQRISSAESEFSADSPVGGAEIRAARREIISLMHQNQLAEARALTRQIEHLSHLFDEPMWRLLIELEARELNEDAALDRFEQMAAAGTEPTQHTFLILLQMYRQLAKADQGIAVFEDMLQRGHLPDAHTCTEVVALFLLALDDTQRAQYMLRYMLEQKLSPPMQLYSVLTQHYANKQDLPRVAELLGVYADALHAETAVSLESEERLRLIQDMYIPLLEMYGRSGRIDEMMELYKLLRTYPESLTMPIFLMLTEHCLSVPSKGYKVFPLIKEMVQRVRLVPNRSFCASFAGLLAKKELLVPLDYLRYWAQVDLSNMSGPRSQRVKPNAETMRLLHYLRLPGEKNERGDEVLSPREVDTFLLDLDSWNKRYFKHRRSAPLPGHPNQAGMDAQAAVS